MISIAGGMELLYKQEEHFRMTVTYFIRGKKVRQFKGKYIPEEGGQWNHWTCEHVECTSIPCDECIMYPSEEVKEIRREYERRK